MPIHTPRTRVVSSLFLTALLAGCGGGGGGVEGKYYNEAGVFTMELKGGKVMMAPGMQMLNANYEVKGDSIVLHDPSGGSDQLAVLVRQKDGSLNAGMLGTLKKK
jgi:hypothetical protein